MKVDKDRYDRIAYDFLMQRWTTSNYAQVITEYLADPTTQTRIALFEEFPRALPTDHKWALLQDIWASTYWQEKTEEMVVNERNPRTTYYADLNV